MKTQLIPSFYGLPTESGEEFNFLSLQSLQEGLPFMGGVTSCFQSHPLFGDDSDWKIQAVRSASNERSHVYWPQDKHQYPHMMRQPNLHFKRAKELNNTMFRISFEMAWLCPRIGEFKEDVMRAFVRMLAQIRMNGMEPMVALYHWPIPSSLLTFGKEDTIVRGGWDNPDIIPYFRFYIESVIHFLADDEKVAQALNGLHISKEVRDELIAKELVRWFITINEPSSILPPSYLAGIFPPYKIARFDLLEPVLNRLVEAHDIAYSTIKRVFDEKKKIKTHIGVAHQWHYCEGLLRYPMQSGLPYLSNEKLTAAFERDGMHTDFLGIQYYYRFHLTGPFGRKGKLFLDHPDLGDMYPPGLLYNLRLMHKQYPSKKILLTEFGFANADDQLKPYLILETVRYACQAKQEGIPLEGMLLWTLVNNFEWACGMNVQFGLFKKESDLKKRLVYSNGGHITSWEVWQVCCKALTDLNEESSLDLQAAYKTAARQFERQF